MDFDFSDIFIEFKWGYSLIYIYVLKLMESTVKGDTWGAMEIRRGRKKTKFWNIGATLELSCLLSNVLLGWGEGATGTGSHSSAVPCAPACPRWHQKIKRGLLALISYLSLSSLVPLSLLSRILSLSLSLSLFPKISHLWYFYPFIPSFLRTHFLLVIFLIDLLIDFLFWVSKGGYRMS